MNSSKPIDGETKVWQKCRDCRTTWDTITHGYECPVCGLVFVPAPPGDEQGDVTLPPLDEIPWWKEFSDMDNAKHRYHMALLQRERELTASMATSTALKEQVKRLEETLDWVLSDLQEWCDAVSKDASWDGWESHYKSFAYCGIAEARAALNPTSGPATGGGK